MRAVRLAVAVAMVGACCTPARAIAQTIDGSPTPAVTIPDTRWASKGLHLGLAGSFATLQALDVISTLGALQRPGVRESNPVVAGMVNRPVTLVATKAATTAGVIYLTHRLSRTRPKTAAILMFSINTVLTAVVASNFSQGSVR